MKYDLNKLLTEYEFAEIKRRIENFELFEFVRFDKTNKIKLRICGCRCDNGIWQNNYMCCIDGENKKQWQGFGIPYQRAEFLKLGYGDIVKCFERLGLEINTGIKQLCMF